MTDYVATRSQKLAWQRAKAIRREAKKIGLRQDGAYKLGDGWVEIEVTLYPVVKWWMKDIEGDPWTGRVLDESRRPLDPAIIPRLEEWL